MKVLRFLKHTTRVCAVIVGVAALVPSVPADLWIRLVMVGSSSLVMLATFLGHLPKLAAFLERRAQQMLIIARETKRGLGHINRGVERAKGQIARIDRPQPPDGRPPPKRGKPGTAPHRASRATKRSVGGGKTVRKIVRRPKGSRTP